jgi:hypothetical protein
MLEINSSIRNKEKEISIDTEYMMLLSLNNDWDKYSIRDFDIIADRIIKKNFKRNLASHASGFLNIVIGFYRITCNKLVTKR